MVPILIRASKRFAILVPGLIIAYLSVFNIFPWLNDHLPVILAAILTYVLAAYLLIPAIIRLIRILLPPAHVPMYCVTPDGFASDPINIGLIGTRQELIQAMTAGGWYETDRLSLRTAIKAGLSAVYDWHYPQAPISNLYLFGHRQDEAFQIPIADVRGGRHHVRFWAVDYTAAKNLSVRSINWHHRQEHLRDDRLLWVGAASRDIGVTFIRHNAQLTHLVDSNTDRERELIVAQMLRGKLATLVQTIKLGEPYKLINIRGWRGHLQTDGRMTVMELTLKKANQGQDSLARKQQSLPESLTAQPQTKK